MKIKQMSFKKTSSKGYPVRIIVKMNKDHIYIIIQRFLIPISELDSWKDFTCLKKFKEVALIENCLAFQEDTFMNIIIKWKILMDKWHDDEND